MIDTLENYFNSLEKDYNIKLTIEQKNWYIKKKEILHEDMTREYPSTPEESFKSSQEGYWFARQLQECRDSGRVTTLSYDRTKPVYTSWDLGQNDAQSIWFFQFSKTADIMVIDYHESSDFPLDQTVQMLNSKGYTYGTHIWPHDAKARDKAGITFVDQASKFNLFGIVLKPHGILDGINLVRTTLSKIWFDEKKCQKGLHALANYKKEWNNQIGGFTSKEVHDWASHAAAAIRYLCAGIDLINEDSNVDDIYSTVNSYLNY